MKPKYKVQNSTNGYRVVDDTGRILYYANSQKQAEQFLELMCSGVEVKNNPTTKSNSRGHILQDAHRVINGERQDTYGSPEDSFNLIAEYWTTYLKSKGLITSALNKRDTAEMMMLFKIARMSGQKASVDNYVDLAGYTAIAADMLED